MRSAGRLAVKQKEKGGAALRNDRYIFCPRKEDAEDEPVAADQVPEHLRREIEQFFLSSVLGTGKTIRFKGWQDANAARKSIKKGMKAFTTRK
ncbi:inorganic diphosphatase [Mesorhizobium sp. PL10]